MLDFGRTMDTLAEQMVLCCARAEQILKKAEQGGVRLWSGRTKSSLPKVLELGRTNEDLSYEVAEQSKKEPN